MHPVPWFILAGVALGLAAAFGAGLGVPRERPPGFRGTIVRWGHALTWLALAATFGALGLGAPFDAAAGLLGLAALAAYVAFLGAVLRSRRP